MKGRRGILALAAMMLVLVMLAGATTAWAKVWTDQSDYTPGSLVTISGDNSDGIGFVPGEYVRIEVWGPNGFYISSEGNDPITDASAAFSWQFRLWASEDAVGSYTYTATGLTSTASQSGRFTDAININSFASDCDTGSDSFTVGATVCAKTTGLGSGTKTGTIKWWAPGLDPASDPATRSTDFSTTTGNATDLYAPTVCGTWTTKAYVPSGTLQDTDTFVVTGCATTVAITVDTLPGGLAISVDGSSYTAPQTFNWVPGSSHTINVTSPQSGGTGIRYVWTSWSDGGLQSHSITVPSSATTYTANFKTQYQLTLAINPSTIPGGLSNITGGANGSWYDDGTVLSLTAATPVADGTGKQWRFKNWTGDVASPPNTSNPLSVTMNQARSITANYVAQYQLTLAINPSTIPGGLSNITGGANGSWYDDGTVLSLTAATPVAGSTAGVGYVFKNWTGDVASPPNTSNPLSVTMDQARSITANYETWVLVWDASNTFKAQYSDQTGLKAVLTVDGVAVSGKTINFSVGSDSGSAMTNSSGVATDQTILTQAPGTGYTASATCSVAQCGVLLSIAHAFEITKEDATATYTSFGWYSTLSPTDKSFRVLLSATVVADSGDVRNATVTFIEGSNTLCTANVGLVNPTDTTVGAASCYWNGSLGSLTSPTTYDVKVVVGGYYTGESTATPVTISPASIANFITGGGYLVLTNSSGSVPGEPNSKMNFGFTVKYNKSGTNPQGKLTVILRAADGHHYQIKSTAIDSLSVTPINTTKKTTGTAVFTAKCSITDLTAGGVSVPGQYTLKLYVEDNGEPGSVKWGEDQLYLVVFNSAGGIWFSSNWSGSATVVQQIVGGNLQVH